MRVPTPHLPLNEMPSQPALTIKSQRSLSNGLLSSEAFSRSTFLGKDTYKLRPKVNLRDPPFDGGNASLQTQLGDSCSQTRSVGCSIVHRSFSWTYDHSPWREIPLSGEMWTKLDPKTILPSRMRLPRNFVIWNNAKYFDQFDEMIEVWANPAPTPLQMFPR